MKNSIPIILLPSFRESSPKGGDLTRVVVEASYLNPILSLGAVPLIVPLGASSEEIEELAGIADGLLIPGGVDINPSLYGEEMMEKIEDVSVERDELEFSLTRHFLEKKKPIFGICRGMQIVNVVMGGTIYRDIAEEIKTDIPHAWTKEVSVAERFNQDIHDVDLEKESFVGRYTGMEKMTVNSLHHQSVKMLGKGLRIGARATDGVVEEIESEDMENGWIMGVQWHPEAIMDRHPENKILFEKFVQATRKN